MYQTPVIETAVTVYFSFRLTIPISWKRDSRRPVYAIYTYMARSTYYLHMSNETKIPDQRSCDRYSGLLKRWVLLTFCRRCFDLSSLWHFLHARTRSLCQWIVDRMSETLDCFIIWTICFSPFLDHRLCNCQEDSGPPLQQRGYLWLLLYPRGPSALHCICSIIQAYSYRGKSIHLLFNSWIH